MKNIIEELREKIDNPKKIKKIIFGNVELKERLIKDSDFLNGSKYDELNLRYKYLRVGGTFDNCKCPYCGNIRKLNASALADTCGSKECMHKHQHNLKVKIRQNMTDEAKKIMVEKMKKTCIERYGVEFVTQTSLMKEKSHVTKKKDMEMHFLRIKKNEKKLIC